MKPCLSKPAGFSSFVVVFALFLTVSSRAGAGTVISVEPMNTARALHTATLLSDGQVLVAGGQGQGAALYLSSAELYDPATGTWSTAGSLKTARNQHTATFLPNGKVLVAGGTDNGSMLSSAELYDPISHTWSTTGSLGVARAAHTATLLDSGKVLVVGGLSASSATTNVEIYDPLTGVWTMTGPLNAARFAHSATLLSNGKVLVAGGSGNGGPLASAELYDPVARTWAIVGSLNTPRALHTATTLPDGTVLVAGGYDTETLSSAEVYDPVAETWAVTNVLNVARDSHTATLLPNGDLFVCGGTFADEEGNVPLNSVEAYNPTNGSWATNGTLNVARYNHTATILPGGRVLIAGGFDSTSALASVELYDPTVNPATGVWTNTGALNVPAASSTATLLPSGQVLMAGGQAISGYLNNAELYNPAAGTWSNTSPMNVARQNSKMTLLATGNVLIEGGLGSGNTYLNSAELYNPELGNWIVTGSMNTGRGLHTSTLLPSGKVLAVGGTFGSIGATVTLSTAEIYDPLTGQWSATGAMSIARTLHTATLLPNGRVLVAGGGVLGAEIFDPGSGTWTGTGLMSAARFLHTATLLPSGKVLVVGGDDLNGNAYASAELYDPSTGVWTPTGSLNVARLAHTATLLPNGDVMVAGGFYFDTSSHTTVPVAATELYDPVTGTWTSEGSLGTAVYYHTATLLTNGQVLVAGGLLNDASATATSELFGLGLGYDKTWAPQIAGATSPMNVLDGLTVTGSQFRGISPGSGGNCAQDSPANYPLVQLRSIEGGQCTFLPPANWSTNSFTSMPMSYLPTGYALATVFVNGTPSGSSIVLVPPPPSIDAISSANGAFAFNWSGATGFRYQVQYITNVVSTNWTNLAGPVLATNSVMFRSDPISGGSANRFYRIALLP